MRVEGIEDGKELGEGRVEIEIGRRQLEGFVWEDKNGKLKKRQKVSECREVIGEIGKRFCDMPTRCFLSFMVNPRGLKRTLFLVSSHNNNK